MIRNISIENTDDISAVFGSNDSNISIVEEAFGASVVLKEGAITVSCESERALNCACIVLDKLVELSRGNDLITRQMTAYLCDMANDKGEGELSNYSGDIICLNAKGKPLKAKTAGQAKYIEAIKNNSVVFGIGPAGTGKTYLSVAMAVDAFRREQVSRIILTRPAVEAGEKLGFLPGDMQSKVDPYLRPLYDAMYDIMGMESYAKSFEKGEIEIAPLAFMRGRTLDNSFIILDEAQNTTHEQLKMFLTRIGYNSKAVINGDITQIDLPPDKSSGLKKIVKVLDGIKDIAFVNLSQKDVVRCELVQKIIKAYDKFESH